MTPDRRQGGNLRQRAANLLRRLTTPEYPPELRYLRAGCMSCSWSATLTTPIKVQQFTGKLVDGVPQEIILEAQGHHDAYHDVSGQSLPGTGVDTYFGDDKHSQFLLIHLHEPKADSGTLCSPGVLEFDKVSYQIFDFKGGKEDLGE